MGLKKIAYHFFLLELINLFSLIKKIIYIDLKLNFIKVLNIAYQSYLQIYGVRLYDRKVFLHTNPLTIVVSIHIFLFFLYGIQKVQLGFFSHLAIIT